MPPFNAILAHVILPLRHNRSVAVKQQTMARQLQTRYSDVAVPVVADVFLPSRHNRPTRLRVTQDLEDELKCHERLRQKGGHPNVLLVDAWHCYGRSVTFIMEAGVSDLKALLVSQGYAIGHVTGGGGPALVEEFAADLCNGLDFMHVSDVIHRDLKPSNVIVCITGARPGGMNLKIADFGCSRTAKARRQNTVGPLCGLVPRP
jgi:serine/threonine protein kinase